MKTILQKFSGGRHRHLASPVRAARGQQGAFLIEGLIAIAIFSIGIVALLGIVGKMVLGSSDARYRVQAAQFADSIISEMRVADPATRVSLYDSSASGATAFTKWNTAVTAALPLTGAATSQPLTIAFDSTGTVATITIKWRVAAEKTVDSSSNGVPHKYVTSTYLLN